MIIRIWRGQVRPEGADLYFKLMRNVALEDYRSTRGNRGARCLRREDGGRIYVTMLSFWGDIDAIRDFAGEEVDRAKYYDFDLDYLIELPERVEHHEVVGDAYG